MAKRIYMAATGQHVGKTSMTLGLICNLIDQGINVGYCKPVGQQYWDVSGGRADKDAVVLMSLLDMPLEPAIHSPVIVGGGDTKTYLNDPKPEQYSRRILESAEELDSRHDIVVFEGTGHPGVGSVVDHSNAQVASMLNADVVLVAEGGVGSTLDKLHLSKNLFDSSNVPILGTIINKMKRSKMEKISPILKMGCDRSGINTLGVVPYDDVLVFPRLDQIVKVVKADLVVTGSSLKKRIRWYAFGSVVSTDDVTHHEEILLVSPGNQVNALLDTIVKLRMEKNATWSIGGLLITAGKHLSRDAMSLFEAVGIPVLVTQYDTYTVAIKLHDYVAKIDPDSQEKIEKVKSLFTEYVDLKPFMA